MYVVWKKRALKAGHACHRCGEARPSPRFALIPLLVESPRFQGKPRQVHVTRLASIRTCGLRSEPLRAAWWRQVERQLAALRHSRSGAERLTEADARAIRWKLAERVAPAGSQEGDGRGPGQREGTTREDPRPPTYLAYALQVRGLAWPCRPEEVKAAFRTRAKQTHPDFGGRAAEFREVYDAYKTVLRGLPGPLR